MSIYNSIKIIVNIALILIIGIIIKWFVEEKKIDKLNKRLGKYSIESLKVEHSIFDNVVLTYYKIQERLAKILSKSKVLTDYSKKYIKYVDKKKKPNSNEMNYVVAKFLAIFLLLILVILSDILQSSSISFLSVLLTFIVGFFTPDVLLLSRKMIIRNEMENDLFQSITIMNNCFKSGRSIMQTMKIVSEEIDGPLKEEFQKMLIDLKYGLTIEEVFDRLLERVQLDELKYISTSLTILNKTGGNIVKVFSSIEKTMFSNRKLDKELKNLTAASKFLYKVLMCVPIIFIFIIYLLDPSYFAPLFSSILGYLIVFVIIFIYCMYIVTVKKIVKIKE